MRYCDPSGYDSYLSQWWYNYFSQTGHVEGWDNGRFSDNISKYNQTPNGSKGIWEGTRGDSLYIPNNTDAKKILKKYGQRGILYTNCEPDFRPVATVMINIPNMSKNRWGNNGNFAQADHALLEFLLNNPNHKLNQEISIKGVIMTESDIRVYRKQKKLTWHEENNLKTIVLVDRIINSKCGHLGGTSEAKQKLNRKKCKVV